MLSLQPGPTLSTCTMEAGWSFAGPDSGGSFIRVELYLCDQSVDMSGSCTYVLVGSDCGVDCSTLTSKGRNYVPEGEALPWTSPWAAR